MATPQGDMIGLTGNTLIDGLLQGSRWGFAAAPTLSYSFNLLDAAPYDWTAATRGAFRQAFAAWSAVANLGFTEVASPADPAASPADLAVALDNLLLGPGEAALGMFPDPVVADLILDAVGLNRFVYPRPEGDILVNASYLDATFYNPGSDGLHTALHEIGHALGLKHPHDDGLNGRPTFVELGIGSMDHMRHTAMSYNTDSPFLSRGYAATPMPLDILAIQHIYGANLSYHTGDDVYRLANDGALRTVWDAGGTDTLDASGLTAAVNLDLRPGTFTTTGTYAGTALAYGVTIERAIGTRFADRLTGSAAGNDLDGRAGADRMAGGAGNDTYRVDNAGDTVIEAANAGLDTVVAAVSHTLPAQVENLTLAGSASLAGSGNELNNVIRGNAGSNVLDGGSGIDTVSYAAATVPVQVSLALTGRQSTGAGTDTLRGFENLVGGAAGDRLTGSALANTLDGGAGADTLIGGAGADTLRGGAGADRFVFNSRVGIDRLTDFTSGQDDILVRQAPLPVGDGDTLLEGAATVAGPGGFSPAAELVIVTGNIAGAITASAAAARIGAATAAYAVGSTRLFAVDNGVQSALYLFTALEADAGVRAAELTPLALLAQTAATAAGDYLLIA
jgi:Ca2+-binding RTX toxin-like protein